MFWKRAVNEVLRILHLVFVEIEYNGFVTLREISLPVVTNNRTGKTGNGKIRLRGAGAGGGCGQ